MGWKRDLKKYEDETGIKVPSVWEILSRADKEGHGQLVKACVEKLRADGYRILHCELPNLSDVSEDELRYKIAPKYGFSYGDMVRHDVVADKNGKLLIVEVSTSDRIAKQVAEAKRKGKVIVVFPISDASNIEVWGLKEIGLKEAKKYQGLKML